MIQPKVLALIPLLAMTNAAQASSATAFAIIDQMGAGWNLGNTMESLANKGVNDETGWGNPKTSQAMIDLLKNTGFHTLRIPVSWDDNISGAPNYTINSAWLDRVEQIVNYGLNDGLYVIINVHHNNGWESTTLANESAATNELKKLWSQIAPRFQKYDRHLIFEVMNEPRANINGTDDWWGTADNMGVVNRMDAAALATIRGTGGNNSTRLVMVPDYVAGSDPHQLSVMVVPNDSMVAMSVHAYLPFDFSMNLTGTTTFVSTDVDNLFKNLKTYFLNKNIPVVLGEWGADNKNNLSQRVSHAGYYAKAAKAARVPCIVWDNNNNASCCSSTDNMGLMNRTSNPPSWTFPTIVQAIVSGWGSVVVSDQVAISTSTSGSGSVAVSPSTATVKIGTSVTFTAKPATGWTFQGWSGASTSTSNPLTLTAQSSLSLTAIFKASAGTNVLVNGDFSNGTTGWSALTNYGNAASTGTVQNGQYVVSISNPDTASWDIQFIQRPILLEKGKTYTLSFDASAQASRSIYVKMGQDGGTYLDYGDITASLSTSIQHYNLVFTMTAATDTAARLEFNLGGNSNKVTLDNVSLIEGIPASISARPVVMDSKGLWTVRSSEGLSIQTRDEASQFLLTGVDGRTLSLLGGRTAFVPAGKLRAGIYVLRAETATRVLQTKVLIER